MLCSFLQHFSRSPLLYFSCHVSHFVCYCLIKCRLIGVSCECEDDIVNAQMTMTIYFVASVSEDWQGLIYSFNFLYTHNTILKDMKVILRQINQQQMILIELIRTEMCRLTGIEIEILLILKHVKRKTK